MTNWFKRLYLKLIKGEPMHWCERERAAFRTFKSGGAVPLDWKDKKDGG